MTWSTTTNQIVGPISHCMLAVKNILVDLYIIWYYISLFKSFLKVEFSIIYICVIWTSQVIFANYKLYFSQTFANKYQYYFLARFPRRCNLNAPEICTPLKCYAKIIGLKNVMKTTPEHVPSLNVNLTSHWSSSNAPGVEWSEIAQLDTKFARKYSQQNARKTLGKWINIHIFTHWSEIFLQIKERVFLKGVDFYFVQNYAISTIVSQRIISACF